MALRLDELKVMAEGRWGDVYAAYSVEMEGRGHVHCPFTAHADRNPSFRFDGRTGKYWCSCSQGDAIDFVQAMTGCGIGQATDRIADILMLGPGMTPEERAEIEREREIENERYRKIDAWHDRQCRAIGQDRKRNGLEPEAIGSKTWWEWLRVEALIRTRERWVELIHGHTETTTVQGVYWPPDGPGEGYVRPADRFEVTRILCAGIDDDYGERRSGEHWMGFPHRPWAHCKETRDGEGEAEATEIEI